MVRITVRASQLNLNLPLRDLIRPIIAYRFTKNKVQSGDIIIRNIKADRGGDGVIGRRRGKRERRYESVYGITPRCLFGSQPSTPSNISLERDVWKP